MRGLGLAVAATAVLFSGSAVAQSAKFAAIYDTDEVSVGAVVQDVVNGSDSNFTSEVDLATIRVPNQKELLITVSGIVNLVTLTEAKGKNGGGTSTSIAEGGVSLAVGVVPTGSSGACDEENWAIPGEITLASRAQELSVTVDLDVVDVPGTCGGDGQPDCVADTLDIEGSVSVALGLDTTAAHSFQFLALDMAAGEYDVVACYGLDAFAQILNGFDTSGGESGNVADAFVALGKRVMTVQEVRAVKDSIVADVD